MKPHQIIAGVLLVFQGVLAAIIVVEPESLGLSRLVVAWMAIANVGVGIVLNQLNRVQEPNGGS